jgi:hypothetical protein
MTAGRAGATVLHMNESDLRLRAEHHAGEAERLLAGRLGLINNVIKAGVHATLAVYYAAEAQRPPADRAGDLARGPVGETP